MKSIRYSLFIFCLLTIVGFVSYKYNHLFLKQPEPVKHTDIENTSLSLEKFKHSLLYDEFEQINSQLASLGVTQEKLKDMHKNYHELYLKSDLPSGKKVSAKMEQFVKNVIQQCGLDYNTIKIFQWNDPSPAGATERVIYINEQQLSRLPESAQLFVIGHEIQHIIHQDNSTKSFIINLIGTTPEKLAEKGKINHPLCKYSRFIEKRADIETALIGKDWAEGYLIFSQAMKRCQANGTHPGGIERISLAQKILDYHNQF